ncbi:MAG: glycosyltransferase family 4 protein [Ectobacillus sp.]
MKILHVCEALDKGGLEEVIYNLVKNTKDDRFDVRVAYFRGGQVAERLADKGVVSYELAGATKRERIGKLVELIKREGFDIVQTHFCFEAISAAKKCGVKVIETVHNTYGFFVNPWGKLKYSYYLNKADAIVAVSGAVKDFTEKHFTIFQKNKCSTIRNSIEPERLVRSSRTPEEIKEELGIPQDATVISTLSRLDVQKGLEYFIDAARKLNERFEHVAFVIPGEGEAAYTKQLHAYAADLKNVYFIGHIPNISDLFAIMDIYVMSSLWEGGQLTLLEAMAYEKPIVTTKAGFGAEVIRDGQSGYVVDIKDARALAERIWELLEDEQKRLRMAKEAHRDFYKNFSNDVMINSYKQLYMRL